MSNQLDQTSSQRPLRLWPGVVIVLFQLLVRYVIPKLFPEATLFGMPLAYLAVLVGLACGILLVLWWLFFSRAPWSERIGAVLIMIIALWLTRYAVHVSIRGGMMGFMLFIYAIPIICLAFIIWAVASQYLSTGIRRITMVASIIIACAIFTLIRTNGIMGQGSSDFQWRWTKTSEEQLLARSEKEEPVAPAPKVKSPVQSQPPQTEPSSAQPQEQTKMAEITNPPAPVEEKLEARWPGFRGPNRDGVVKGIRIKTDWSASPPKELWRRPIGPGWSSFAVAGNFLFTQEQRGDDEVVSCYRLTTGKPVWKHRDPQRFYESNAGAGPRGTPTFSNGYLYTFGATGILNALNANDGSVVWKRDVSKDAKRKIPGWGFSSSPLVIDDVVVVAAAGKLVAYDISNGKPRWYGPDDRGGYSSPHLATIGGSQQVVFMNASGVTGFAPATGDVLWHFNLGEGTRIVQPAIVSNADLLVGDGEGTNIRRIAVTHDANKWSVKERWNSIGLKPYFNDFVVHNGHAYGFDGTYISCIDLNDGAKKWKGGKYGAGQLILLADQDVLLVVSEKGDLALVSATPDQFKELGHVPAIHGKTWNHPALVDDILLVRNGEEMAAFRLALEP